VPECYNKTDAKKLFFDRLPLGELETTGTPSWMKNIQQKLKSLNEATDVAKNNE